MPPLPPPVRRSPLPPPIVQPPACGQSPFLPSKQSLNVHTTRSAWAIPLVCTVAVLSVAIVVYILFFVLYSMSGAVGLGIILIVAAAIAFVGAALYMIPTWIAVSNQHAHAAPICVVNIMLGWTLVGWVGALVWALMPVPPIQNNGK